MPALLCGQRAALPSPAPASPCAGAGWCASSASSRAPAPSPAPPNCTGLLLRRLAPLGRACGATGVASSAPSDLLEWRMNRLLSLDVPQGDSGNFTFLRLWL